VQKALAILGEATRRYPEDVEAWYALGDTYYHLGYQALADAPAQAERAFGRAIELDPTLSTTHIHLIENAFALGDSALARQRIDAFRQTSPSSPTLRSNELAFDLAFGSEDARQAALTVLDTASFRDRNALATVTADLSHPSMQAIRAEAVRRLLEGGLDEDSEMSLLFASQSIALDRGRWDDFWRAFEFDNGLIAFARPLQTYFVHVMGLPVPEAVMADELALTPADTLPGDRATFPKLLLAAERGQEAEVLAVTRRWRTGADSLEAAGDSLFATQDRWASEMLEARVQWATGDPEGALARIEPLQREATGWEYMYPLNEILRKWAADLSLELGDEEEAEVYLRSLIDRPIAVLQLARLRDEAGDLDEAASLYARLIDFWQDADPELQPYVEEARSRLQEIVEQRG
jgi:hypothetical protein